MNILQGVGAMLFFMVGHQINANKLLNIVNYKMVFFLTAIFVSISTYCGALSLVRNYYSHFIINFPASVLAFISLYKFSDYVVNKQCLFRNIVCKIGRITILILCIHIIELEFDPIPYYIVNHVNIDYLQFVINPICHIVIACSIALLLERCSIIRKIFNLR